MAYHAYILASNSGVLYIGVTNNLERRVFEHKSKLTPGFTSLYNVNKLVHFESFGNVKDAIAREKQWKSWRRQKKVTLLETSNPEWRDLSEHLQP